ESVVGMTDAFKPYPERRGLYRPNPARGTRPAALKAVAAAAG
ncbi:MAG TPA: chemotaxis protein CheR, partial [Bradyrhizobium sp.]|nr:chemotaxis protein CheR [Bradyrhizobium sp.]